MLRVNGVFARVYDLHVRGIWPNCWSPCPTPFSLKFGRGKVWARTFQKIMSKQAQRFLVFDQQAFEHNGPRCLSVCVGSY